MSTLDPEAVEWLMEGDPAIRWQTMRDLLDAPEDEWQTERCRVAEKGWGAEFLACQNPDGSWPEGRWTGTVWTLLLLVDCGLPKHHPTLAQTVESVIERFLPVTGMIDKEKLLTRMDLCHLGFWLRFGSYFLGPDPRMAPLAETILSVQFADGGWNCHMRNYPNRVHSSFHTTFNVLEGLREAEAAGVLKRSDFRDAEARALEFVLAHRMYKSDRTGEVVREAFTHLTYPSHWHYTVLRGLDHMRLAPEIADERLEDAIELIQTRRRPNGRWPVERRIPGITLFDMEKPGSDSRWNTLRAMRVLKARTESRKG